MTPYSRIIVLLLALSASVSIHAQTEVVAPQNVYAR